MDAAKFFHCLRNFLDILLDCILVIKQLNYNYFGIKKYFSFPQSELSPSADVAGIVLASGNRNFANSHYDIYCKIQSTKLLLQWPRKCKQVGEV